LRLHYEGDTLPKTFEWWNRNLVDTRGRIFQSHGIARAKNETILENNVTMHIGVSLGAGLYWRVSEQGNGVELTCASAGSFWPFKSRAPCPDHFLSSCVPQITEYLNAQESAKSARVSSHLGAPEVLC
jgi:hypothetical protein